MREALARFNPNFELSEPRQSKKDAGKPLGFLQKSWRAAYFAATHANLFVGLLFAALLITIFMNALLWQKDRHPAPLFGHTVAVQSKPQEQPARTISLTPVPAPRPAAQPEAVSAHPPVHTQDSDAVQAQKPPVQHDAIAQLLKVPAAGEPAKTVAKPVATKPVTSNPVTSKPDAPRTAVKKPVSPAASSKATPNSPASGKAVFDAQRALQKLWFVIKPDGVMNATTHDAIKQFERDHKLPAHGTLSPRTVHDLSAASGIVIE